MTYEETVKASYNRPIKYEASYGLNGSKSATVYMYRGEFITRAKYESITKGPHRMEESDE